MGASAARRHEPQQAVFRERKREISSPKKRGLGLNQIGGAFLRGPHGLQSQPRTKLSANAHEQGGAANKAIRIAGQSERSEPCGRLRKNRHRSRGTAHSPGARKRLATRQDGNMRDTLRLQRIENEAQDDGSLLHGGRHEPVSVRQTIGQIRQVAAPGHVAELAGQRRRRAGVRIGKQHVDHDDAWFRGGDCVDQARHHGTWQRPGAQALDRATIDIHDHDRDLLASLCPPQQGVQHEHTIQSVLPQCVAPFPRHQLRGRAEQNEGDKSGNER